MKIKHKHAITFSWLNWGYVSYWNYL